MNSKIIGFILSEQKIDYKPSINTNILIKDIQLSCGVLSVYYYGDIALCEVDSDVYSMGFPPHKSLFDYNLLISVKSDHFIIENDWLGAIPCFYNTEEKIVSTFPKVCLRDDKAFSETGLYNYLKYGFSVFGETPFKAVSFLYFSSKLTFNSQGIQVQDAEDPLKNIDDFKGYSEDEIWTDIDDYMAERELKVKGDIVIPTSAGYDSRIINYFTHSPERVVNYSYGISDKQERSFEVIEAQKYAKTLNHRWKQVKLGKAYDLIPQWHDLFAYSTHLHGMYQMEFYTQLMQDHPAGTSSMISGICGGIFTGSNTFQKATEPADIYKLAFTHGLNYEVKGQSYFSQEKLFMEKYAYLFEDLRFYPIITMRIKLILLSYLMTVPSIMGMSAWTPFLNFNIVMKMLNLPADRREGRKWVKEFFASKNMQPHKNMFMQDTKNKLNLNLHLQSEFNAIADDFALPMVSKSEITEVNDYLGNMDFSKRMHYNLCTTRVVKEVLKKVGITNQFNQYLTNYQTLKAIEMCL